MTAPAEPETCCGWPMKYQDIHGIIRRYQCQHRSHHPAIYVSLLTGLRARDEDIPYQGDRDDDDDPA